MIKHIAKGILNGMDNWADSQTQEQFNDKMALILLTGAVATAFILGVYYHELVVWLG